MRDQSEKHNAAMLPLLRLITEAAREEADQWVIIESLCLGIGKLHGRDGRETAEFVDTIAERIASGDRK